MRSVSSHTSDERDRKREREGRREGGRCSYLECHQNACHDQPDPGSAVLDSFEIPTESDCNRSACCYLLLHLCDLLDLDPDWSIESAVECSVCLHNQICHCSSRNGFKFGQNLSPYFVHFDIIGTKMHTRSKFYAFFRFDTVSKFHFFTFSRFHVFTFSLVFLLQQ